MINEYAPGGLIDQDYIWTVNEFGEEVQVPISQIPELQSEEYSWGDAMVVTFDDETGGTDE